MLYEPGTTLNAVDAMDDRRPRLADALARVDRVLARSAKIEAVYGGRFSAQPGQAGVAIDCSIELIRYRLFNAWSIAA
jgi:hypothetical protein